MHTHTHIHPHLPLPAARTHRQFTSRPPLPVSQHRQLRLQVRLQELHLDVAINAFTNSDFTDPCPDHAAEERCSSSPVHVLMNI